MPGERVAGGLDTSFQFLGMEHAAAGPASVRPYEGAAGWAVRRKKTVPTEIKGGFLGGLFSGFPLPSAPA